ncbi:hypothetical protein LSAT2_029728 [Lamellibrachia satsuma]|nr:hypothetical protein LSAT2_029728 [Lamellibrachia satsuma]
MRTRGIIGDLPNPRRASLEEGLPDRRYSSSALITMIHGRRFSSVSQLQWRRLSMPAKSRRMSTKYTTHLQDDVIHLAEQTAEHSTGKLLLMRTLALLVCLAILAAGLAARFYLRYPYYAQTVCLPRPLGNATVPPNSSLPLCDDTTTPTALFL